MIRIYFVYLGISRIVNQNLNIIAVLLTRQASLARAVFLFTIAGPDFRINRELPGGRAGESS